jgi:hypothetical protein
MDWDFWDDWETAACSQTAKKKAPTVTVGADI